MDPCPPADRLERLIDQRLAGPEYAAVARHVEDCAACQDVLERLTGGEPRADAPTGKLAVDSANFLNTLRQTAPAADPVGPPAPPGYEIRGELGRGGMGVVYEARQVSLDRLVALKMLRDDGAGPDEVARLRREAGVVARLRHPNIVQVFDVGEHAGRPYFSMELVRGGSLARRADGRPVPATEAAALAETLARAVHAAHEAGVVHRDLKPGNILLTETGEPKVTDFGLARRLDLDQRLTATGSVLGTPSYMAPEQAAPGAGAAGPAADVYALGAILYELLTGRPPFLGPTPIDTLIQVRDTDPVPPTRLQPGISRDLETVCLKCLEKDPNRRYPAAAALAEDLRRWRAGESIAARPAGAVTRTWKWAKRRPAPAALVGLVALVVGVGFPVVTVLWRRAETNNARAEAALDEAEANVYYSRIAQAAFQVRSNDVGGARRSLDACAPAPGRPDRRGWEWDYLDRVTHAELLDLGGHRAWVNALAYSPDGHHLISGGGDPAFLRYSGLEPGELLVRDAATGRPVRELGGWPMAAVAVAVSPDGGRLACTAAEARRGSASAIRVWDLHSNGPPVLLDLAGATAGQWGLAFSPDGRSLATWAGYTLIVWGTALDRRFAVRGAPRGPGAAFAAGVGNAAVTAYSSRVISTRILAAAFTRDGREVLCVGPDGRVTRRDAFTGTVLAGPTGVAFAPARVAFSPNRTLLAAVEANPGSDRELELVTLRTIDGTAVRFLRGHAGDVLALAFAPDGRTLATAGVDATVRVWDTATGRQEVVFRGHTERVHTLAFSPDGRRLSSGGWDGRVKVWDLDTRPESVALGESPGRDIRDNPDSDVRIEDLALRVGPGGPELVAAKIAPGRPVPDGEVQVWSASARRQTDGRAVDATRVLAFPRRRLALSPGGRVLAGVTAGDDRRLAVWDVGTGTRTATFDRHAAPVGRVDVAADGRTVASAGWDPGDVPHGRAAEVWVWDAATGGELAHLPTPGEAATAVALSGDGRRLAVAGVRGRNPHRDAPPSDVRLRVWDLPSGRLLPAPAADEEVVALAWDGGGSLLAMADVRGKVGVWDGTGVRAWDGPPDVSGLAFSPDARRLAGVTRDRVVLWDPRSGQEVLTLSGRPRQRLDPPFNPRVVFSPDGRHLAASQWDHTAAVWSATRPSPPPRD